VSAGIVLPMLVPSGLLDELAAEAALRGLLAVDLAESLLRAQLPELVAEGLAMEAALDLSLDAAMPPTATAEGTTNISITSTSPHVAHSVTPPGDLEQGPGGVTP
jgi:hypothetical protein